MYYYFFINLILTVLVLTSLAFLRTSPFRVRFRITHIALCSWIVPYDFVRSLVSQYQVINFPISLAQYNDNIRQAIVPQITTINNALSLSLIITILSTLGIILFAYDLYILRIRLKKQQKHSVLYKKINGINCYSVANINAAFSFGISKPVIWFDNKYFNHPNIDSLLQHELQHIKQSDHLWLLMITFIQRLLWWNPLVRILSTKSRELIELSCDQACATKIGKHTYQKHLANLMVSQNHSAPHIMVNNFFGKSKFNIFRIKKLSEEFSMNRKHKSTLLLSLIIMTSILFTSMQSISRQTKNGIPLEEITLTKNQIIIEVKVNLYSDYTYENVQHVDKHSETSKKVVDYQHRSIEAKMVAELGKTFKLTSEELKGYEFEAIASKTDNNNIFLQTDVKFISDGENIHLKPALEISFTQPGRIIITDDDSRYKYEMDISVHQENNL